MKAKINGIEIDCTVDEFKKLTGDLMRAKTIKPKVVATIGKKNGKALCKRKHKRWTSTEDAELMKLNHKGVDARGIGKALGRTTHAISMRVWTIKKNGSYMFKE